MSVRLTVSLVLAFAFALPAFGREVDATPIIGRSELPGLSIREQSRIVEYLSHGPYRVMAYYVPRDDESMDWVNPELRRRLFLFNESGSGANCYWTSHFAHGTVGLPERLMGLADYFSILKSRFDDLGPDAPLEPGDILRLRRVRGAMDTHSVTYLGTLKGSAYSQLVLTKNGPADGPFLILRLRDLTTFVYPSSRIANVYRLRR